MRSPRYLRNLKFGFFLRNNLLSREIINQVLRLEPSVPLAKAIGGGNDRGIGSCEPSFQQIFCNQQSLWKDNNKIMVEFLEFMKNRT